MHCSRFPHVPDAPVCGGTPDSRGCGVVWAGGEVEGHAELRVRAEGREAHPDDGLARGIPRLDLVGIGILRFKGGERLPSSQLRAQYGVLHGNA